jgi:hypothetical protein
MAEILHQDKERTMDFTYTCPHCNAVLNPGENIVLMGRSDNQSMLFAFHPEPGNYEFSIPHKEFIEEGELWDFICPVCHTSLAVSDDDKLAVLDMTDGVGNWHKVFFSRIAGDQATFVISKGKHISVEEYGADLSKYEKKTWHNFI